MKKQYVYDMIMRQGGPDRRVIIRCSTHEEWCALYHFAKSAGYEFCTPVDDKEAENFWFNYEPTTRLIFRPDKKLQYGYTEGAYNLSDTDLCDIICPTMDLDGDVISVLQC